MAEEKETKETKETKSPSEPKRRLIVALPNDPLGDVGEEILPQHYAYRDADLLVYAGRCRWEERERIEIDGAGSLP